MTATERVVQSLQEGLAARSDIEIVASIGGVNRYRIERALAGVSDDDLLNLVIDRGIIELDDSGNGYRVVE